MKYLDKNPFECKQKGTVVMLCVIYTLFFITAACGSNSVIEDSYGHLGKSGISCDNKRILKVLKDEPAIVQKTCFEHNGRVEEFFFSFVNENLSDDDYLRIAVFPVGDIPKQYRKEGLSVCISGNVISCYVLWGCVEPNIRLRSIELFELKSIKINNIKRR